MEQCDVTADHVDLIAKASGGDIRHAITSLQFFCLNPNQVCSLSQSTRSPHALKEESTKAVELDDGSSLYFGRDETLSLFHALGKFLHNKRETGVAEEYGMEFINNLVNFKLNRNRIKLNIMIILFCSFLII
jgi:cell cycle checkpoint protein